MDCIKYLCGFRGAWFIKERPDLWLELLPTRRLVQHHEVVVDQLELLQYVLLGRLVRVKVKAIHWQSLKFNSGFDLDQVTRQDTSNLTLTSTSYSVSRSSRSSACSVSSVSRCVVYVIQQHGSTYIEHLFSPRMAAEIKEGKNTGTANEQWCGLTISTILTKVCKQYDDKTKEKRLANTDMEISQHALVKFKFLIEFVTFCL